MQARRELRLRVGCARGLLRLEPARRRPDLDALHRPRPGDFVGETGVFAERRRDEDSSDLVDRTFLRGRDEAAHQKPHRGIELRERGDLLGERRPLRRRVRLQAGVEEIGGHEKLVRALRREHLAKARREAGPPLRVDLVLVDARE